MAPSPSPSTSPSSSKKLTMADPKPKPKPKTRSATAPPNSASSSSTTNTPPPEKRTRDQPNLSDCHCCGRRINHTNPKDRLQPLDSVWRIVLLCRTCRRKLHYGQTCPYCFQETGNSGDLLTCSVCERKIHKDCVRDYGNCTPWCYLGVGSEGFRVCVDCWVPELLKNSIGVCGRSENKSRFKDKGEARDLTEKVVKDVGCEVEKKVKIVSKAKEQALRSAKVPSNEVDLANGVMDSSGKKDKDGSEADNLNCSGAIEVVDDAELAIQLHRVMNSSPRILRSKCSVNSNASDVLNIRTWKGLSYKRSRFGKNSGESQNLEKCANSAEKERINRPGEYGSCIDVNGSNLGLLSYKRDKRRKIWKLNDENTAVSESRSNQPTELNFSLHLDDARTGSSMQSGADRPESSICLHADQSNSCINVDRFGQELLSYKRSRFKRREVNGLLGGSGECSSYVNQGMVIKSVCCPSDDAEVNTGCVVNSGSEVILPSGSCDAEWDRYSLKYSKRVIGTKSDSSFMRYGTFVSENKASLPALSYSEAGHCMKSDVELILPNETSNRDPDRYSLKYAKRVKSSKSETKAHTDDSLNEVEASAPRLTTHCSAESRTLSDVSLDSCTIDLPK